MIKLVPGLIGLTNQLLKLWNTHVLKKAGKDELKAELAEESRKDREITEDIMRKHATDVKYVDSLRKRYTRKRK